MGLTINSKMMVTTRLDKFNWLKNSIKDDVATDPIYVNILVGIIRSTLLFKAP